MSGPQFLGIGIQKSGTTWLYRNLLRHPDIWMPHEKELHYWDEKVDESLTLRDKLWGETLPAERWRRQARRQRKKYRDKSEWSNLAWDAKYFLRRPTDDWYVSLFRPGKGNVSGEITPDYSTVDPEQIQKIAELLPDVRMILFLRNPIERAWSHAQMEFRIHPSGEVTDQQYLEHFATQRSRRHGDYMRTIRNWTSAFPADQIFIGYLEDVHYRPGMLINGVYDFLGVDRQRAPAVIRQPVHVGSSSTIPTNLASALAKMYASELQDMGKHLGGHADRWRRIARVLRENPPPSEAIEYPFWNSAIWPQVWRRAEEGKPPPNSSGPLDAILDKRRKEVGDDNG